METFIPLWDSSECGIFRVNDYPHQQQQERKRSRGEFPNKIDPLAINIVRPPPPVGTPLSPERRRGLPGPDGNSISFTQVRWLVGCLQNHSIPMNRVTYLMLSISVHPPLPLNPYSTRTWPDDVSIKLWGGWNRCSMYVWVVNLYVDPRQTARYAAASPGRLHHVLHHTLSERGGQGYLYGKREVGGLGGRTDEKEGSRFNFQILEKGIASQ